MKKLVLLLASVCLYAILPNMFTRKIIKSSYQTSKNGVLLTFDDGPNPLYTPQLLVLLKQHNIRAVFFVIGDKVKKYPQLIRQMHTDGHVIGVHHFTHRHSAVLTPYQLYSQLKQTKEAIEQLTNEPVFLYRPPYGHLTAATGYMSKKLDLQLILWSDAFGDWRSKNGTSKMLKQFQQQHRDGAIYLLHDDGQNFGANDDAPKYMLKQLAEYVAQAERFTNPHDVLAEIAQRKASSSQKSHV